jgi:hypothetical protein
MAADNLREHIELAGLIAIVISLVLLGYEIRQNTLAVQSSALQQHFEQHTALVLARIDSPELQTSLERGNKGWDALTEEDRRVWSAYTASVIRNHFVAYELMRSGLLPASQWQTFHAALGRTFKNSLGARQLWQERRTEYPDEFRAMADALVKKAEMSERAESE